MTRWAQQHLSPGAGVTDYPDVVGHHPYREVVSSGPARWLWNAYGVGWVITSALGHRVSLDSTQLTAANDTWYRLNGKRWWILPGSWYLWWNTSTTLWCISRKLGACVFERWRTAYFTLPDASGMRFARDNSTHEIIAQSEDLSVVQTAANNYAQYVGDLWWSCATFEGLYLPRGSIRGNVQNEHDSTATHRKVTWSIIGHRRAAEPNGDIEPAGVFDSYERVASVDNEGAVTPNVQQSPSSVAVGLKRFVDQAGTVYLENMLSGSAKRYGSIWYAGLFDYFGDYEGWLIGDYGSPDGWYEGDEPDVGAPVVFERKRLAEFEESANLEAGYPGPSDLTITFDSWVLGPHRESRKVAQPGLWV